MFKRAILLSFALKAIIDILYLNVSSAQEIPFIPETLSISIDLNNELSGERSIEHIRWMSHYHRITGQAVRADCGLLHKWCMTRLGNPVLRMYK